MYIYIVVPVDAPKLLLFDFKRILFKIEKLKHFGGGGIHICHNNPNMCTCLVNPLTFLPLPSSATVNSVSESELAFLMQFLASRPLNQYKISMKETRENPSMRPKSPPT